MPESVYERRTHRKHCLIIHFHILDRQITPLWVNETQVNLGNHTKGLPETYKNHHDQHFQKWNASQFASVQDHVSTSETQDTKLSKKPADEYNLHNLNYPTDWSQQHQPSTKCMEFRDRGQDGSFLEYRNDIKPIELLALRRLLQFSWSLECISNSACELHLFSWQVQLVNLHNSLSINMGHSCTRWTKFKTTNFFYCFFYHCTYSAVF